MPRTPNCDIYGGNYDYDSVEKECCYDYSDGVSCLGSIAGAGLLFDFCSMVCDNGYLNPGETVLPEQAPYSDYVTSGTVTDGERYGYPWDPPSGGWDGSHHPMDYDTPCKNLDSNIAPNAGVGSFLAPGDYYCIDSSGSVVDCGVDNTAADSGTFAKIMNPAARWVVSARWEMMGCGKRLQAIQNHQNIIDPDPDFPVITYNRVCSFFLEGIDPVLWLGCLDGFSQQSNDGLAAYGTGFEKDECLSSPDADLERTERDYVPVSFKGLLTANGTPDWSITSGGKWATEFGFSSRAYNSGTDPSSSSGCSDIAYLDPTYTAQLACYEDYRSGCPPISEGGGPPCYIPCQSAQCPPGYTYDPVSGLCIEGFNSLSSSRGFAGKRFLTQINNSGDLVVHSFDDTIPPVMSTSHTLFSAECAVAHIDRSGGWWIFFSDSNNTKYVYNKDGGDSGAWSSPVNITEFDGFRPLQQRKLRSGGYVFLLWKEDDSKIYIGTAETDLGGTPVNVNAPVKISDTVALPSGDLIIDSSGKIYVYFQEDGGSITQLVCSDLAKDGTGTWL